MQKLKILILYLFYDLYFCWDDILKIRNFTSDRGYEMNEGAVSFFFLKDCLRYDFKTCFALNADSPYGLFHLPPNQSEKQYKGCITKTDVCGDGCNPNNDPNLNTGICYKQYPMQWRLQKEEVILILGTTPPDCTYWSITPYLMSSFYEKFAGQEVGNFTSVAQKMAVSCKDGPARCSNFASLYQPYNLMKFKNNNDTIEFRKPFSAIFSANKQMSEDLSLFILQNYGIQPYIFKIPADILKMGVEDDYKDMFTMLMRVAYPLNITEMENYFLNPPMSVYRITPKNQIINSNIITYKANDSFFMQRENKFKEGNNFSNIDEKITYDTLVSGLEELKNKIVEAQLYNNPDIQSVFHSNFLQPFFVTGLDCLNQGTECNGDTPDTLYPISENIYISQFCSKFPVLGICIGITLSIPIIALIILLILWKKFSKMLIYIILFFILAYLVIGSIITSNIWRNICQSGIGSSIDLEKKDTYIIYGVNHAKTKWARYSSITAYHYEKLAGLFSASSEKEYINSAKLYLGKQHPLVEYYFVYRFTRNCSYSKITLEDNYCFDVPFEGVGSVPKNENIFFIERMYVNPNTQTGPTYEQSIASKMIHFR
jgi:hypothetical protein